MGCSTSKALDSSQCVLNDEFPRPIGTSPSNIIEPVVIAVDSDGTILPCVGHVIKAKRKHDSAKVFINIFHHQDITKASVGPSESITTPGRSCIFKESPCTTHDHVISSVQYKELLHDEVIAHKVSHFFMPYSFVRKVMQVHSSAIARINKLYSGDLGNTYSKPIMKRGYVGELSRIKLEEFEHQYEIVVEPQKVIPSLETISVPQIVPPSTDDVPTISSRYSVFGDQIVPPPNNIMVADITAIDEDADDDNDALELTNKSVAPPTGPPARMCGWCLKEGHLMRNWQRRYFVLDSGYLTYYEDHLDVPPYGKNAKGSVCLSGYSVCSMIEEMKHVQIIADRLIFERRIRLRQKNDDLSDTGGTHELMMEVEEREQAVLWLAALVQHVEFCEASMTLPAPPQSPVMQHVSSAPSSAAALTTSAAATLGAPVVPFSPAWAKWLVFVNQDVEHIIFTAYVGKPNPFGHLLYRQLILTDLPRFIYVDDGKMAVKGDVSLAQSNKPSLVLVNESSFVITAGGREYKFVDVVNGGKYWVDLIQSLL